MELRGSGAEPLEAADPRRIGRIPLAGRLGVGGMGRVYLGIHEGRYVAVKQLLASVVGEDKDFLRRFGRELDNLSRLPAEATVPLLASDRTAHPPWFATAYVPGLTLRQAVELHEGPLPPHALWLLLRKAATGLASVHALDMVHRDLKPSNVMLTLDGLTLIDFGVARAAEQSQLTRTGMVVGTPAYMAPEQALGTRELSGATDVFALGSVLAYAACGRPPFGDESGHGVLYRIVHEEPDLADLRELDPELAETVATCLDKDPDRRPTAAELLERTAEHGPSATEPLWPTAITDCLSERTAFAAARAQLPAPEEGAGAGSEAEPGVGVAPEVGAVSGPIPEAETRHDRPARRRRTRVLLAVLPVVVGGATLAVQYLPDTSAPWDDAQATPSTSVTAPADPTGPTADASPSDTKSPKRSSGDTSGADGQDKNANDTDGNDDADGNEGAGAGQGGAGGSGAGGTGDGADGGGGSDGSAASGGSGSSGGSATSGGEKPPAAPPPASGTRQYRNGDNGMCVSQTYAAAGFKSCADSSTRWTVRSGSGGSFKLVNEQSGNCLYSNGMGQGVFVGSCSTQNSSRLWSTGSGGTLRADHGGGCLDLSAGSALKTDTCNGQASQRWTAQAA